MQTTYIVIEGGGVKSVSPIPEGIEIVVIDYDIDGVDPLETVPSPLDQNRCVLTRHGGEP